MGGRVGGSLLVGRPASSGSGVARLAGRRRGPIEGVIFDLDFNAVKDGKVVDKSPSHYEARLVDAEVCEGVDGYAVRLPGSHACVTVDLAEADRKLDQLSLDLWVSPEEAAHQEVITAGSARSDFDDLPIMLRWRQGWQMGFSVQAADNERRCMIPTKPCLETISFPRDRLWMHVVATYDGETTALYINGQPYESRKWPGKKAVMPIALPVKIGGHGGLFRGARGQLPPVPPRPDRGRGQGTLRGARPFPSRETPPAQDSGHDRRNALFRLRPGGKLGQHPASARGDPPLEHGRDGNLGRHPRSTRATSSTSSSRSACSVSRDGNERYYREVSGKIQFRRDGSARLEIAGKTATGLQVEQSVQVNDQRRGSRALSSSRPTIRGRPSRA